MLFRSNQGVSSFTVSFVLAKRALVNELGFRVRVRGSWLASREPLAEIGTEGALMGMF